MDQLRISMNKIRIMILILTVLLINLKIWYNTFFFYIRNMDIRNVRLRYFRN